MRRAPEFLGLIQSQPDDIELPNLGKTSHHERFKAYAGALSVVQNEAGSRSVHCFNELVKTYQKDKECLLAAFVKSRPVEQRAERLDVALECANVFHGKNGHNTNVIKCCEQFLETEQIRDLCGLAVSDRNATAQQEKQILEAARYHGLSDFEIPVRVLVAKGRLSAGDKQTYIDPRSENSAHVVPRNFWRIGRSGSGRFD